jgi:hypothetical protein
MVTQLPPADKLRALDRSAVGNWRAAAEEAVIVFAGVLDRQCDWDSLAARPAAVTRSRSREIRR